MALTCSLALPFQLASHQVPGNPPPSLHPHYQASSLLRGSPPLHPASVLPSQSSAWGSRAARTYLRLRIGATGSHVPLRSLSQARATSMPDTAWAVSRLPPDSSRGNDPSSVLISLYAFDTSSVVYLLLAFLART